MSFFLKLVELDQQGMACFLLISSRVTKDQKFLPECPSFSWSGFTVNGRIRSAMNVIFLLQFFSLMLIPRSGFAIIGRIRSTRNGLFFISPRVTKDQMFLPECPSFSWSGFTVNGRIRSSNVWNTSSSVLLSHANS